MAKTNAAFMSGIPELVVLRLLSRAEMYGYELIRAIRIASGESIVLAEGVVYPTLHGLEQKGLLKAKEKMVKGRVRVYYQTTAKGKKRLATLENDWQRINSGVEAIMRRLMWQS